MLLWLKPPVKQAAFSLLELIVVILIIGILTAAAIPRFSSDIQTNARSAAAIVVNELRFAQQLAMNNTERTSALTLNSNQITISQDGTSLNAYPITLDQSVTFDDVVVTFDSNGNAPATTISITPDPGFSVCVVNTGFAYLC
ncbi:MAG: prepilin-type N-terminal cleavage/methylation domain-containing protein [Gammaproteobacteria bacterium]|nr:prepilin-type N-terminal cleavage/methylation domain-containing protein [Gammaproteobacteria bacterium]NVK87298.1 prepilin-type N-terminal cleavage/methylation domain-containing protein [Gammaproteobacteria bacterium]